jgi:hypothetical protein
MQGMRQQPQLQEELQEVKSSLISHQRAPAAQAGALTFVP